jgi:hypothetical protein
LSGAAHLVGGVLTLGLVVGLANAAEVTMS